MAFPNRYPVGKIITLYGVNYGGFEERTSIYRGL
jgi:hypothetical protein